ncbi:MAG: protein phosphatase 2C domain-containing protein [Gammaproteobacteria bacterium]|nr:protein phosphatase 2C domain-containing protein [Gammaproteobacteria bacterium]
MNDITIRRPVLWSSAAATDPGTVRAINEDAIFSNPEIGLWAVADGMGGHEAGDVASNMIAESLNQIGEQTQIDDFISTIENSIKDVNCCLLEYSHTQHEGRVIGSTVAVLFIMEQTGVCLWAGDSRLYRFRNSELKQMTTDHSHVSELLRDGLISPEEAENHPEANVITRAVGTYEHLQLDVEVFDARVGDAFLLCSDGLYNAVEHEKIRSCLLNEHVTDSADCLIEAALHNNAADNVSVVVVKGTHSNIAD